jgi:hypothetical protein
MLHCLLKKRSSYAKKCLKFKVPKMPKFEVRLILQKKVGLYIHILISNVTS